MTLSNKFKFIKPKCINVLLVNNYVPRIQNRLIVYYIMTVKLLFVYLNAVQTA